MVTALLASQIGFVFQIWYKLCFSDGICTNTIVIYVHVTVHMAMSGL